MILKGSERGGAGQLAAHLLKTEENEHVEIYDIRGFMADDLRGALHEAWAVSRGTRCRKFLFSMSLNPPETAKVPQAAFNDAINKIEEKLGLQDQPRVIVFHEKEGRRHAHCVWSRIDSREMKAINLPHFKLKLRDISRKLYMEHGWTMPKGLADSKARDPFNFTRAEWQQARRAGHDPRALKEMFRECWAMSDSKAAFARALEERGYTLARGDRRGYVAVDFRGEVYAIAKWTGLRTKEVKARLGDPKSLPSLSEASAHIAARMTNVLQGYVREAEASFNTRSAPLAFARADLTQRHRHERRRLKERQEARWTHETNRRAARLRRGLRGLWDRLSGTYRRIRRQNEREAYESYRRDTAEKDALILRQLDERQVLQQRILQARQTHARELMQLHRDVARYMSLNAQEPPRAREHFREATRDRTHEASEHRKGRGRTRRRRRDLSLDL